jgi:hypothetical protein
VTSAFWVFAIHSIDLHGASEQHKSGGIMSLLIHEVAKQLGIHTATIKRAEKRGLISSQRDVNNWRRFAPDVVDKLKQLYVKDDGQQTVTS